MLEIVLLFVFEFKIFVLIKWKDFMFFFDVLGWMFFVEKVWFVWIWNLDVDREIVFRFVSCLWLECVIDICNLNILMFVVLFMVVFGFVLVIWGVDLGYFWWYWIWNVIERFVFFFGCVFILYVFWVFWKDLFCVWVICMILCFVI